MCVAVGTVSPFFFSLLARDTRRQVAIFTVLREYIRSACQHLGIIAPSMV